MFICGQPDLSIVARHRPPPPQSRPRAKTDIFEAVERIGYVDGFGEVVRAGRERLGLTQEELANLVQERVSVIKKVESGSLKPPLSLARNLEKVLKVRIIKELSDEDIHITPPPSGKRGLTIGDLLSGDRKK